ncbi:MAG TPA: thioesterase domain-containing protein [Ktedonosporobacter sp.]|nr:thioesterase domain-containing protein [Ktedonosporobacter sp.]
MKNLLEELQETLYTDIPLTKHLAITVDSYDDERLLLKAPLAQNINHKGTAFAGSLNAVVTLAGWGLLWLVLKEMGVRAVIVIQDSASNYLLPVKSDFSACCYRPDSGQIARMKQMLLMKGRARLELKAEIVADLKVAVSFQGRYVVSLYPSEGEESIS